MMSDASASLLNPGLNSMRAAWKTSQLSGANSAYLEAIYEDYLADPNTVEPSWKAYFDDLTRQMQGAKDVSHEAIREAFLSMANTGCAGGGLNTDDVRQVMAVMSLIQAYRTLGHRRAKTDPLGLAQLPEIPELTLGFHGLSSADLDKNFDVQTLGFNQPAKLKNIISELERIYCGKIGVEYAHMFSHEEKSFIQGRLEEKQIKLNSQTQKKIYQELIAADGLEKYLGMKYVGQKRFSLEGGDSLIPMVNQLIHSASEQGVSEVVMGMAHRGRLNILVNVLGKSPEELMAEFEGRYAKKLLSGDVKYHNGFSSDLKTPHGIVHAAMAFNPSHLEIVAPVVSGSVRAKQDRSGLFEKSDRVKVLPITIHGDAAFAGQGVVMENLNLSQLRGFATAGTVRIVVNNQVGFTTSNPLDARSGTYCTDVAKMIDAPVFHVNGDDPEAVYFVTQLALDYRMRFQKDVVIDLVCYRLHGHNESDEPFGTQPLMYQVIRQHAAPHQLYSAELIKAGVLTPAEVESMIASYKSKLETGKPVVDLVDKHSLNRPLNWGPYLGTRWDMPYASEIKLSRLVEIAKKLDSLPDGFILQKQVAKTLEDRALMTAGQLALNWGYAEVLAYATLIEEGHAIRLVGQDAGRGTFSHRHAVLHNQKNDELYLPLRNLFPNQPRVEVIDSTLSEEAVMAFEYGYSCSAPSSLVIWEAQFGDFANGAQVVIDQFICAAEEKWGRLSGLVLFLPHGQEGMGAEHSSARLERFLQLCANDNMQVCVPTTPAQIYHLLRRQVVRPYRKPLVVMTPKSLLRHPLVTSSLEELANNNFKCVIDEIDNLNLKKLDRLILCQGKVFYDLLARRREEKIEHIGIIRLEQLYPFPEAELKNILKKYSAVKEIVWCQEEPLNQGAWHVIQHWIEDCLEADQILTYAGRESFASPAVGYSSLYKTQQEELIKDALKLK